MQRTVSGMWPVGRLDRQGGRDTTLEGGWARPVPPWAAALPSSVWDRRVREGGLPGAVEPGRWWGGRNRHRNARWPHGKVRSIPVVTSRSLHHKPESPGEVTVSGSWVCRSQTPRGGRSQQQPHILRVLRASRPTSRCQQGHLP